MVELAVIANWAQGTALSGGDRIFIELSKQWALQPLIKLHFLISKEGWHMCKRSGITDCAHTIWSTSKSEKRGMLINLLLRTVQSIKGSFNYTLKEKNLIYSSSDFWPDSIPAFIMKLRNPKIKWIAGFYLFAPKPWKKDSPYKGARFLIGIFYFLTQLPIYWVVKKYADIVFVTSEPDVKKFITEKRGKSKIVVVRGGVDTEPSEDYLKYEDIIPVKDRKYDACFIGRFHQQKGILELMDIWKLVCRKKKDAKLAVIGVGPLEREIKEKIIKLELQGNIELLGFQDGKEKFETFKQSKTVVHPAVYDSGGMAACEAMAWGLPAISFDLEALKTYYPKGMIKTECFNFNQFSDNIISLLTNKKLYESVKEDALSWTKEWNWENRASEILKQVMSESYD